MTEAQSAPGPGAVSARRDLTRHFYDSLFDMGELSGSTRSSMAPIMAGVAGVVLAIGALLARVYLSKYTGLGDLPDAGPYERAIVGDLAFLIALPMWVGAILAVLVGPALFPDELDFRILMGLPITRRLLFAAKLVALIRFLGLFVGATLVATLPLLWLISINPYSQFVLPVLFAYYLMAAIPGSLFAILAVVSIRAIVLLTVPRNRLLPVSAAIGSAQLFVLVIALLFVAMLPATASSFASRAEWLAWVPPAWFAGFARLLMGDGRFADLALIGAGALGAVAAIGIGAYIVLYAHFDRVMLRAAPTRTGRRPSSLRSGCLPARSSRAVLHAVRDFAAITLRRSALHQGIIVTLAAVGVAVVSLSLPELRPWSDRPSDGRYLRQTAAYVPLVLVFVCSIATRAAMLLPIEIRANWVFRMTERPADRADRLEAAAATIRRVGVAIPILITLPLSWLAFGWGAISAAGVTFLCGSLLVEFILRHWRRVPFTCSYIVGKAFVPQLVIVGFFAFFLFTGFGGTLVALAALAPGTAIFWLILIGSAVLVMRANRRGPGTEEGEQFEDMLPTDTNALRISGS
jgi:hypothetical protein